MKLRGLFPNSYIHVFVSDLYIPTILGIYKLLADTVHLEIGHEAAQFHFWEYIKWFLFAVYSNLKVKMPMSGFKCTRRVNVRKLCVLCDYTD
jgi:hypothetical protein